MEPTVAADRKKAPPQAVVAAGADIRTFQTAGDVFFDPDQATDQARSAGRRAVSDRRGARRLQRRRFRPHPAGFSQRRHASLDRRRGDRKRRPARIAIPAHRWRTATPRSRLSPDRATALAPGLENRVRRLSAAAFALAPASGLRSHRLWTHPDRRAAPLAFLALCAID